MLISRGWNVKQVQYWLGHTDIETTLKIYAHHNRKKTDMHGQELQEITASVDDLFK